MKPLTDEYRKMLEVVVADAQATHNKAPAYQMYTNDWLASPSILAMNSTQEGGYIHLLNLLYSTEDLSLPDDQNKLAGMSRLNSDWKKLGPAILGCFMPHILPGKITNRRAVRERLKHIQYRQTQTKNAAKRWAGVCQANADALPSDCPRKATGMLFPLSFLLCPLSDCPFHPEAETASGPSPSAEAEKKALNARIKKVVDWFYEKRLEYTKAPSSQYDGKHIAPKDRNAAKKILRWTDSKQYAAHDDPDGSKHIRDCILAALRHEFSKNVPDSLAAAVCCFDSYIDTNRPGGYRNRRPAGSDYRPEANVEEALANEQRRAPMASKQ